MVLVAKETVNRDVGLSRKNGYNSDSTDRITTGKTQAVMRMGHA